MSPYRQQSGSRTKVLRYTLLGIAVLMIAGLFVAGFYAGAALGLLRGPAAKVPGGTTPPGDGGPAASPPSPPVTTEHTQLEFTITYAECGCRVRETRLAGMELAGLTEEQVAQSFSEWSLQSFSESAVSFFQLVQGLCPEMRNYRTLGVQDGHVAVFLGRPGTGLVLQRATSIPVNSLAPADRERLSNGIVLTGDAAVERFIEGLSD